MANELLDPQLSQLPDDPDPNDPLAKMGYEAESNAERQAEIDETPTSDGETPLQEAGQLKDSYGNVKQAGKAVKAAQAGASSGTAEKAGAGGLTGLIIAKNAPKGTWMRAVQARIRLGRVKAATAKKAMLQGARSGAAKMAAKRGVVGAAGRVAATLLSEAVIPVLGWIMAAATAIWLVFKTKIGKWIIIGLLVLIALPGIFFAVSFGAIGAAITPSTPSEKAQAVQALALAGDPSATRETIISNAESMKKRLSELKVQAAKKYGKAKADQASSDIKVLTEQLDALIAAAGNTQEREKILKDINAKLQALSTSYPELLFSVGNCADLQKYIDEKKLWDTRKERQKDLKTLPKGILNRGGHATVPKSEEGPIPANPKLCGVLVFILNNGYTIGSVTLTYGHRKYSQPAKHIVSQHFVGEAVDLALINGVGSPKSAKWQAETDKLQQLLQDHAAELGIYELWGPHPISVDNCHATTKRIADHDDHIHIGLTNDVNVKKCK